MVLKLSILLTTLWLSGCQTLPEKKTIKQDSTALKISEQTLQHAYDFVVIDTEQQSVVNIKQLAEQLREVDVVFIGEFHGNQASHLLEMQLQAALFEQNSQQVLSMEMFNRDQQDILNRYLDDEIGEKYLINEAPTWPNYSGSYRPMIEFAKQHFIPVIAANASADIVRCIGSYGQGYESLIPEQQRRFLAKQPYLNDNAYQQKFSDFMDSMRQTSDERKANSYAAQLARDNTMAESILTARQNHPEAQIIHLNGSFHSEAGLGTVALLKQRAPELQIAVITPIRIESGNKISWTQDERTLGDYLYFVTPQPVDYRNTAYKMQARQTQFNNAKEKTKRCYAPNIGKMESR
ncbi:hypothetical protein THMIRHAS_23350 [Thiosulfatimonas sediminis]|uniref:Haem-binding uptake Tiki superfamily ChaN domain-containing protein n=2 Tax=Thiosulfatimonas sediminis TaxID=2675054 RepID=A0A6F8PXT3_9GAMM|nr:hypothetical protein THMIRHAS_23350 [Thiosulfatimonas sediminis]